MRYTNQTDAQTLRRKAAGPAALMQRRRILPVIPTRGTHFTGFGASSVLSTIVTTDKLAATGEAAGLSIASAVGAGAAAGSVLPIVGTAIGAIVGLLMSGVFSKQDQEVQNFNQAIAIAQSGGPEAVVNILNKYLVLAGLFDLDPGQVGNNFSPFNHYGRLGEQQFVTDMMNRVYSAAMSGQITANDTPQSIFNNIVNPWIQSMGTWTQSMPNAPMLAYLMMGMIAEYAAGLQTRWLARGGDYPFGTLPKFFLPAAVQQAQAAPAQLAPAQPTTYPLPPGMTQTGTDPSGAWIVQAGGQANVPPGTYLFNPTTNQLTPYTSPSALAPLPAAPVSAVVTPAPTAASSTIDTASQGMVTQDQLNAAVAAALAQGATAAQAVQAGTQYVTSAGVPYSAPIQQAVAQSVSDQTGTASSDLIGGVPNIALLAGAALLLVLLLKKKGRV